jgi:hypothetical protein
MMRKRNKTTDGGAAKAADKSRRQEYEVIADLADPLPVTEGELEHLEREKSDFLARSWPAGSREAGARIAVSPLAYV